MSDETRTAPAQDVPFSEEAEEAVLGAILVNPDAFYGVAEFLKSTDFYFLRHQYIWQALERLNKRDEPVDYLMLSNELKAANQLDVIGGLPYLTRLITSTPTSLHAAFYGHIVEKMAIRRRLLAAADEIRTLAHNEKLDVDTIQTDALARLMNVAQEADRQNPTVRLTEALNEHLTLVTEAFEHPEHFAGITSSIPEINQMLNGGYWNTEFVVFAARPRIGKSSMLMTDAFHAARTGKKVALFSMEMPTRDIVGVLLAEAAAINSPRRMLAGKLSADEYSRYVTSAGALTKQIGNHLFIDDTPAITPTRLMTRCKLLKARHGLDAVFVDYLQLMGGGGEGDYWNRQQEIGFITRSLKQLAKELDIPVIAACQVSRAVEGRQDKRPTLDTLRESGDIENDANVIFGIHRETDTADALVSTELIPLKARDADISGIIEVWFEKAKKRMLPKARQLAEAGD